jgi:enolase-phosphatase E1
MASPGALLLDIEGTTTPVQFVHDVLFPYARARVQQFLSEHGGEPAVEDDLAGLRAEYEGDLSRGETIPAWDDSSPPARVESAAAYARFLIDQDRKATPLKSLQGKIWAEGYRAGALASPVYDDVFRAFRRWREDGRRIAIFSSGSVLAQKLLFAHTSQGDLSPWIAGYFDTTTGSKREPGSYTRITARIGLDSGQVLFVSDTAAELDAATAAGLPTRLCVREDASPATSGHLVVRSFDDLP